MCRRMTGAARIIRPTYGSTERRAAATVFDFRMGRGREGPARFLGQFEGILQTDEYIAYERGVGGPKMVHAACWAIAKATLSTPLNSTSRMPTRSESSS